MGQASQSQRRPLPPQSRPVPAPSGWLAGWVLLLRLLLAAAAAAGGKSSMRGSGGEPPVAVATAGQRWRRAAPACWLHPLRGKRTVGGRVISELIRPRTGRGESRGALKAAGGTAVQRRALCLLSAGLVKAAEFSLSRGGVCCCLWPCRALCSPCWWLTGPQGCASPTAGQGEQIPQADTQQSRVRLHKQGNT